MPLCHLNKCPWSIPSLMKYILHYWTDPNLSSALQYVFILILMSNSKKIFSDVSEFGLCFPKYFISVPLDTGCKMDVSYYDDLTANLRDQKTCVACRLMIFGNYVQESIQLSHWVLTFIICLHTGCDGCLPPSVFLLLPLLQATGGRLLQPRLRQQGQF